MRLLSVLTPRAVFSDFLWLPSRKLTAVVTIGLVWPSFLAASGRQARDTWSLIFRGPNRMAPWNCDRMGAPVGRQGGWATEHRVARVLVAGSEDRYEEWWNRPPAVCRILRKCWIVLCMLYFRDHYCLSKVSRVDEAKPLALSPHRRARHST